MRKSAINKFLKYPILPNCNKLLDEISAKDGEVIAKAFGERKLSTSQLDNHPHLLKAYTKWEKIKLKSNHPLCQDKSSVSFVQAAQKVNNSSDAPEDRSLDEADSKNVAETNQHKASAQLAQKNKSSNDKLVLLKSNVSMASPKIKVNKETVVSDENIAESNVLKAKTQDITGNLAKELDEMRNILAAKELEHNAIRGQFSELQSEYDKLFADMEDAKTTIDRLTKDKSVFLQEKENLLAKKNELETLQEKKQSRK